MSYWSLAGLYTVVAADRVLALVDHENAGSIVVTPTPNAAYTRILEAGTRADATVDAYLRGHYAVPLATVPTVIADAACAILAYSLYFLSDNAEVPEKLRKRFDDAMRLLEHVRDDKVKLLDEETGSAAAARTILVNKTADDRLFSSTVLDQF